VAAGDTVARAVARARAAWSRAAGTGGRRDRDLRDALAELGRDAAGAGLVVGSGGNLSARRPGAGFCWVTASGAWLDRLGRADFVRVPITDTTTVAPARGGRPSSEVELHRYLYRVRPDVNAIAHLHPQAVILLDALGEHVRLVSTDHAYYLRKVVRVGFHLPGTRALAAAAARAAADGADCLVLAHHGCVVLADTVDLAHKRARYLEEAAQLTWRALALGRPDVPGCPPEFLRHIEGTAARDV